MPAASGPRGVDGVGVPDSTSPRSDLSPRWGGRFSTCGWGPSSGDSGFGTGALTDTAATPATATTVTVAATSRATMAPIRIFTLFSWRSRAPTVAVRPEVTACGRPSAWALRRQAIGCEASRVPPSMLHLMHRWARALPSALALLAATPLLALAAGPPFPDPVDDQAVYDTAGMLSSAAIAEIEALID